jgi:hypothetical protein
MSLDVYLTKVIPRIIYSANITHNLAKMADKAGLYRALWRPEEIEINTASKLIPILEKGIEELKSDPSKYRVYEPDNKWGTYEGLVRFVENYLAACKENPDSEITISR